MTVDELDELSVELKAKINALRDVRREAKAIRDDKVHREALSRKLTPPGGEPVSVGHLTSEQVRGLLGIAMETPPREGDVVVTPEHVTLKLETPGG